jgi:ABC-2 type transport system ATP-binding protein
MGDVAISIQDVSKRFRLYHERGTSLKERFVKAGRSRYDEIQALNHISLDIEEGQSLGILGHNGSGKSTLLKCMCGVLQPTSGQVVVRGTLAGLLELGAGFQQELSGRDNVYLNGSMLGLSRAEIDRVFDDIVEFSELEQFIDNQVKFYSSGMYVRLGFAVAVNVQPDILVIDEVLAVGDERFQRKCLDKIREFQGSGKTIVFVTQAPELVRSLCDSVLVLSKGNMVTLGEPGHSIRLFREGLLESDIKPGAALINAETAQEEELREIEFVSKETDATISITEVVLEYPNHKTQPYLRSGDPVKILVKFLAHHSFSDVVFSLVITDPRGETLLSTNSDFSGSSYELTGGEGEFEFSFPSWPLLDGRYLVSIGVQSRLGGVVYDWKEDVAAIEVLYDGQVNGLLNLPLEVALQSGGDRAEVGRE